MSQVSRRTIPKEVRDRIYRSFFKAIGLLNEGESELFLNDLLTPTERIMLPKRLAVAILLRKRWSYNSIRESLKVTQTTVASVSKALEHSSGLATAVEKLGKNEAWNSLWQDVESLLYRLSSPGKTFMSEEMVRNKLGIKKRTL